MIKDLRRNETGLERAGVCIVGAGAAGIALAIELNDSGLKVLVLETGGERFDPSADDLSNGESVGVPFVGLRPGRYRGLGGATRLWAGQCVRLDPSDFAARPWVEQPAWPIRLDELSNHYERAERFFGLSGREQYDERIWPRFAIPDPSFDHESLRARFTVYSPHPDIMKVYRRRLRDAANVTVALYGHALQLHLSEDRTRIESLDVGVPGRTTLTVRADRFVLCNGGIESARLLLLSNAEDPRGVGNTHDNVGRYYQDHPNADVATVRSTDERRLNQMFTLLYRDGKRYFPKLRLAPEAQERDETLNAVAHLRFVYDAQALADLRSFVYSIRRGRLPPRAGRKAVTVLRGSSKTFSVMYRRFVLGRSPNFKPQQIFVQAHVEQAPDRESRISLGDALDAFGQRKVRMDWRLGEREHHTFATLAGVVRKEFARLGLGSVEPLPWTKAFTGDWAAKANIHDAYHYAGATRMSSDPASGVVATDLHVHGVDNLYVCSGSVFPTSGYANPTLTIVALALRLADLVRQQVRSAT